MTPDSERRALREAVRAFRLAVTTLKDPAPALFADLSAEEGLRDLTQELPLVSFSPLDALPDVVLTGPDERPHLPGSGSGRASYPSAGREATPTGAGSPRASMLPRSPQDLPGAALPQDDEPAVRPPVFSFRRSGPAEQRHPSQHDRDVREGSTEEAKSTAHAGRFRVPGPTTPEDRQREMPAPVDARSDPPDAVRLGPRTDGRNAGPDYHAPGEQDPLYPVAPPSGPADGSPEAAGGRGPNLPLSGPGDLPLEGAYRTEREANLPEPDLEAYGNSAIALIGSLAERLLPPQVQAVGGSPGPGENAPGKQDPPHPMTPPNDPAGGFPEAMGGRGPDLLFSGPGDLPLEGVYRTEREANVPGPDLEAYGNSAIALIGSLAERLLPPQVQAVGDLSSRSGEHDSPHPIAPLNGPADSFLEAAERLLPPQVQAVGGSSRPVENAPGEHDSAHPVVPPNDPAGGFPEAMGGRGPDLPLSGPGDLPLEDAYRTEREANVPEPDLEAYGNSAISLIDSLAERLLPPQVQTVGGSSGPGENAPAVAAPTASGVAGYLEEATALERSPFAFSERGHGETAGGSTFGSKPSGMDEEVPEGAALIEDTNDPGFTVSGMDEEAPVASDRYMDAETFASLVNDVLVEQARRHGVDLS